MISVSGGYAAHPHYQCVISPQDYHIAPQMMSSSLSSTKPMPNSMRTNEKEANLYNSVFSKLAHNKSIEEISTMIRIYNNTTDDNYEALFSVLTQDKYRQLATELYNLKITKRASNYYERGYEKLRLNIIVSFESLLYSMYQTKIAASNKRIYEGFKKDSETLHDKEKLRLYIENLSFTSHILPEVVVSAPLMQIKPEYSLYIKKYGVPANGIWNPDLLSEMIDLSRKQNPYYKSSKKQDAFPQAVPKDKNERISVLQAGPKIPPSTPSIESQSPDTSSRNMNEGVNNIVMNMPGSNRLSAPLPLVKRKRSREERRRNPIDQTPIVRRSTSQSSPPSTPTTTASSSSSSEGTKDAPSIPSVKENANNTPSKVSSNKEYIPWEQWEMIPLAYWNALLR